MFVLLLSNNLGSIGAPVNPQLLLKSLIQQNDRGNLFHMAVNDGVANEYDVYRECA